jgi:outer membrane lipoprotein carrier protein
MALMAVPVFALEPELSRLLQGVESRYNGVKTLQVSFEETFKGVDRPRRTESGELFLRKPGRMRWEYTTPKGKLFISDGKAIFYYNASTNTAEKMKLKESDDLRAPLAFLLGKLDFEKDFGNIQARTTNGETIITAQPKSDRLPYRHVEFTVTSLKEIKRLVISGQDNSLLTFAFWNERMNPTLDEKMFQFSLPSGATWSAASEGTGQ